MEKIKQALTGHSSSDSNKLQKNDYDSSTTGSDSKLQHPISNSEGGTYGTHGSNNDSYGSNTVGNNNDSYGSNTGSSNIASSRDYPQTTSGQTGTTSDQSRMPGGFVDEDNHAPTHDTYSSNTSNTANKPFSPYSSKGQQIAAGDRSDGYDTSRSTNAASDGYDTSRGTNQTQNYSRPAGEDSLSRSRDGGILNQSTDQPYSSNHGSSNIPTGTEQRYDSQRYEPNQSSTGQRTGQQYDPLDNSSRNDTSSSHHYGRDAALAGGVGAGGVGAYELGKDKPSSQPLTQQASSTQGGSYGRENQYGQQDRYGGQDQYGDQKDRSLKDKVADKFSSGNSSSTGTESRGLTEARKRGGDYESGYRAAIEHIKAEMEKVWKGF